MPPIPEELPELDGAVPDFHEWAERRSVAAGRIRSMLGGTPWSEDLSRPSPSWLIPSFLQRQSIHVISAPKAARKTWLGLHTMLCGVYQKRWLGMGAPSQPFQSVYIAADSPRWDVRSQMFRLVRGWGEVPQPPTESGTFVLPFGFKFTNQNHVSAMVDLVASWGIDAIFIDVLLYTYDGMDENDNSDMGRLFQLIKYFRDNLGLAVVLLHHHAKNPLTGARGAGTILQAAEHHYELRRTGPLTVVNREKLRGDDAAHWSSVNFALNRTINGGVVLGEPTATPIQLEDFVVTALAAAPQTRAQLVSLATLNDRSPRWLDGRLATLREEGRAASTNGVWQLC